MQRPQLPLSGLRGKHTLRYLDVHFIIRFFGYKVCLRFANPSDIDMTAWKDTMSRVLDFQVENSKKQTVFDLLVVLVLSVDNICIPVNAKKHLTRKNQVFWWR